MQFITAVSSGKPVDPLWANRILLVATVIFACSAPLAPGAGVTLVTHGYQGNVTEWVIPMCNRIPSHPGFAGTNYTIYQLSITRSSGVYYTTVTPLSGVSPVASESGEIIIALDWSTLSGLGGASSTAIAAQTVNALLSTNLIPELGGRPLGELPLHLIGHSRGASVIAEMARLLGASGVWVDHQTTLDPYPVSLLGDPSVKNYLNVLYADNYWQNIDTTIKGQSLSGAYNRQLAGLVGGYSSAHSDVHLWYHATIDLNTPTGDNLAVITNTERMTWWTAAEAAGTNAGFLYSLIGGGDRLSSFEPAGPGNGRIVDGFNKVWDLGAGLAANRTALPANSGAWPNLLRLNLVGTNRFAIGDSMPVGFYHQYSSSTAAVATIRFSLDADMNPYNGNEQPIAQTTLAGTGTNNVLFSTLNLPLDPATTLPGTYALFARISDATHARYLYAPQPLVLAPSRQPPVLAALGFQAGQFRLGVFGWPGQTVVLEASTNFAQWVTLTTNTLAGTTLELPDPGSPTHPRRYYRAHLLP
jgi:hypothetical protein